MLSNLISFTSSQVVETIKEEVMEFIVENPEVILTPIMPIIVAVKLILKLPLGQ